MKLLKFLFPLFILITGKHLFAQNYTSLSDGLWTTPADWNNTSGWGTSTPPVDGSHGSGTITLQNNMSITGNYVTGSPTLNIQAGKTLTVNGDLTETGGTAINVSGTLVITGNLSLSGVLNILPGGKVIVDGSATVVSANYLIVGTGVASPPYADLIIYHNLSLQSSGDVTLNQNSRVAIFGNVTDDGSGGTFVQLNNGAEAYVNGNVSLSGGGDHVNNANAVNPYGLYVNGTTTNSGGGSTTTANEGNKVTLQTTNVPFYSWVASLPGNPLPITLLYVRIIDMSNDGVSLEWATASEINFDRFEIERSIDGQSFVSLGAVKGHGTTSATHVYQYTDRHPLTGRSYYRLRSVDTDGSAEFFPMVMAELKIDQAVQVYPNPVIGGLLHIDLNFVPEGGTGITVFDLFGGLRYTASGTDAENLVNLSLPSGTYILRISSQGFVHQQRISIE